MFVHSKDTNDMWTNLDTSYDLAGLAYIGNNYHEGDGRNRSYKCAIRFQDITITGSINYAGLYFWTQYDGRDESPRDGGWNFKIYGIDEDNTGSFSSSPLGRTKTSNSEESSNGDEPNTGTWKEVTITNAVKEVLERGGFFSGNSLGIILEDNGSGKNKYAGDVTDRETFLVIRKSAEPNFKPTPKTVSAPILPAIDSTGIRISYPGYDVDTATEGQLYFTSRKRCFKVIAEGKITTTAGVVYNIAHGKSYKPCARAFFKSISSTKRYKIPRFLPGEQQDPDADTTNGRIEIDSTNVKILTTDACEVYYYIYLDELSA